MTGDGMCLFIGQRFFLPLSHSLHSNFIHHYFRFRFFNSFFIFFNYWFCLNRPSVISALTALTIKKNDLTSVRTIRFSVFTISVVYFLFLFFLFSKTLYQQMNILVLYKRFTHIINQLVNFVHKNEWKCKFISFTLKFQQKVTKLRNFTKIIMNPLQLKWEKDNIAEQHWWSNRKQNFHFKFTEIYCVVMACFWIDNNAKCTLCIMSPSTGKLIELAKNYFIT